MSEKSGADRLLDEAIDLIIRLQNDPDNPVAQSMIKGWRARSSRHEQIWQKVSGAHGMTGQILTDRDRAERTEKAKITRRKLLVGGLAGLGAAGTATLTVPQAITWARADHITPKGEVRRVMLADGSYSTLGPESAIALRYRDRDRRIELLEGMAYFEVAPDAARPFIVETRGLTIRALGTTFDVSDDADCSTVCVANGVVEAQPRANRTGAGFRVAAGEWLTFDSDTNGMDRGSRDVEQIGSWRDGLLVAEREPISALLARIARWHPGRIVVLDPRIGREKVSGLYDLKNPAAALAAIVHPAGARVRHVSSYLTVISPI